MIGNLIYRDRCMLPGEEGFANIFKFKLESGTPGLYSLLIGDQAFIRGIKVSGSNNYSIELRNRDTLTPDTDNTLYKSGNQTSMLIDSSLAVYSNSVNNSGNVWLNLTNTNTNDVIVELIVNQV